MPWIAGAGTGVAATKSAGGAPVASRLADGAAASADVTGRGGVFDAVAADADTVGPGGTGPPAYAGDTTPTTKAADTTTIRTAFRRNMDNLDSNRGFEASTLDQDQAVLIGD